MAFAVRVGEPDVTHRTSWREGIDWNWVIRGEATLQLGQSC